MAKEGSKRVEISGIDDKRQITGVYGSSMAGDFLPIQLVYQGKTPICIPSFNFPPDWDITFTHNHWCNKRTVKYYIEKILVPYITRKREELKLNADHRALVIYDVFRGQWTQAILKLLHTNNFDVVFVPPNCTDR
uniref:DDE-1 domain-containing protein n=1 Tax=Amphimedon queenslandica TaxID=400682 RepID=A0A1X7V4F1_AMPQE